MSIEKKALAPMLAMTLFRGWVRVQQYPIVLPSIYSSMSTQSVDQGQVRGNETSLSTARVPKQSILRFSCKKHNCYARIFFREQVVTGIQNFLEKMEKKRLKRNSKSISFSRLQAAQGCLTLTATSLPFILALQTCETDPEATGSGQKCSNSCSMDLPYMRFIVYSVLCRECTGEPSLRTMNLSAISYPIISARWLRYWKAFIHTNPARFTHHRKTYNQKGLVRSQRQRGRSNTAGVKIQPSSTNRSICHPAPLFSYFGSSSSHSGKTSTAVLLEWQQYMEEARAVGMAILPTLPAQA